jgi:hypothetical protein
MEPLWIALYNLFRARIENLEHQIARTDCPKKRLTLSCADRCWFRVAAVLSRAVTIMKSKRSTALTGVLLAAFGCAVFPVGSASTDSCVGNCGTLGANGVVTLSPFGNPAYQFVSTNDGVAGAAQIAGVGGANGSQFTTSAFSANAGDALQFFFNYVTSDGVQFADYAWAELQTSLGAHVAWLFTARTQ